MQEEFESKVKALVDGGIGVVTPDELELVMTCSACPEQYDVHWRGLTVGYLRLRHGEFTIEVPDCGGVTLLRIAPMGDGAFEDDERDLHLGVAKWAICFYYRGVAEAADES